MKKNTAVILVLPLILASLIFASCATGSGKRREKTETAENLKREIEFGRLLSEKIVQKYPVLKDEKATYYVNMVGKSVSLFSGRTDIEYHFAILNSDTINAFAAPAGYIFITKGALLKMKSEAELAAVLAHEIGHVNNKHIIRELPPPRETGGFINTLAALLVAQGAAVSSALGEVVNKASELLFSKGYKRDDEFEADRYAVYYTAETGYSPSALLDFLKRIKNLEEKNKEAVVYNTHPSPDERLDKIKKVIDAEKFSINRPDAAERFGREIGHLKAGK